MSLDGNRLGQKIAAAIAASRPPAGEAISDSQLVDMWQIVGNEIVNEFIQNGTVTSAGATGTGGERGPYPIIGLQGMIS